MDDLSEGQENRWRGIGLSEAVALRSASQKKIEQRQLELLRLHLRHALATPYYRKRLKEIVVEEAVDLRSLLASLPLTPRADLERYAEDFTRKEGCPIHDIALTSGTTGTPLVIPYSAGDLQRLAFNEAVAYYSAGVRPSSRVLLTVTLDRCFIAGLAYYSGVTFLGAAAIRSGPGNLARQWQLIEILKPDTLVGVPSFLLELGRYGAARMDVGKSSIKTIITIGEPARMPDFRLTPAGAELAATWQARIHSSYGSTELEGAFAECCAGQGGHVHPEMMIAEIVDEKGNVLPAGEPGEVVVTPLGVEGFPLVRFKTGDVARVYNSPCECGWNTSRLGPIEGRLAQRLKCKGTTLYPESIFHVLQEIDAVCCAYVEVRSQTEGADEVKVVVGSDLADLDKKAVEAALQARLRVVPEVVVQDTASVTAVMRGDGGRKPRKFFDYR
ncbi:MAG: CoF synthetase [Desulfobacterales bacterium]|nr:MAG: CoF synthetase [Desulfobacterales bacterium]